jgi:multiple sugar transport system substrate-binding protein
MTEKKDKKTLSRRQFLILSGQGALALGLLAGCVQQPAQPAAEAPAEEPAGGEAEAEPAQAPVELEFLAWGDAAYVPAWDELARLYEEENPSVTIKVTSVSDPNTNYYPKLQTAIAGGAVPHVASFQGWEWQKFEDNGVLAPIDEFIKRDNFTGPYPEGVNAIEVTTKRKGKTYLVPLFLGTMLMFYAKRPFDEAGIPYPAGDWTFDEFIETAEKLTDTSGDARMFGLQANGSWFRDIHYIRNTGKQEFDELVDPKKAQFNQPEIVDIVQTMAFDVYHTMKISPTPADLEGGATAIETGNVAMKYEGAWFFGRLNSPELREAGKEVEFDVALMPKQDDPSQPYRGWAEGIALPKTDNVEAAWGFAHFMGSEEGDKLFSEIAGTIPNTFDLIESFWVPKIKERFGVENGKAFVEAFSRSEIDVTGGVNRAKMWSEVVKPVGYDPLLGGSATAAEVLPKVDEGVQGLLDEYWASVS